MTTSGGLPFILDQSGDIPGWAQQLSLKFYPRPWEVRANDQVLPWLGNATLGDDKYAFYDLSLVSGQTATLSFITPQSLDAFQIPQGYFGYLDDSRFVVPEPSTYALLAMGGIAFVASWAWRPGCPNLFFRLCEAVFVPRVRKVQSSAAE